ncbi:immunoreactive antigen PG97 [Bacteroidetes oral taxon 274 str. F0058]|nr:immunoreactive antigen PG97 [Bacteroidetes oral taxon 274 str. F0058]
MRIKIIIISALTLATINLFTAGCKPQSQEPNIVTPPKDVYMELTIDESTKNTDGTYSLLLHIKAQKEDMANVWVDINNNGEKDKEEELSYSGEYGILSHRATSPKVTVYGKVTYFDCKKNNLVKLNISTNPFLEELDCSWNDIKVLIGTEKVPLEKVNCSHNKIYDFDIRSKHVKWINLSVNDNSEESMNSQVIKQLPDWTDSLSKWNFPEPKLLAKVEGNDNEKNVITNEHIKQINAKGWKVYFYINGHWTEKKPK